MPAAPLLALAAFAVPPAFALDPYYGLEEHRPADGEAGVALNLMPVVTTSLMGLRGPGDPGSAAALTLHGPGGDALPAAVIELSTDVYQLVPEAPLEAGAAHQLRVEPGVSGAPEDGVIATFTAGDAEDREAPVTGAVRSVSQRSDRDEWGDWHRFGVEVEAAADPSGVLYEVTLIPLDCALGLADCAEPPTLRFLAPGLGEGIDVLSIVDDPTGRADPGATADPADTVVQVVAVDLAGNRGQAVCSVPAGASLAEVGCAEGGEHVDGGGDGRDGGDGGDGGVGGGLDGGVDGGGGAKGGGCAHGGAPAGPVGLLGALGLLLGLGRRRR